LSPDRYRPPPETWKTRLWDGLLHVGLVVGLLVWPFVIAWRALPYLRARRLRAAAFGPIGRSTRAGELWVLSRALPPFGHFELNPGRVTRGNWTLVTDHGLSGSSEVDLLELELENGEKIVLESMNDKHEALAELIANLAERGVLDPAKRREATELGGMDLLCAVIWVVILFVLWGLLREKAPTDYRFHKF
jgi:hypothetical protein